MQSSHFRLGCHFLLAGNSGAKRGTGYKYMEEHEELIQFPPTKGQYSGNIDNKFDLRSVHFVFGFIHAEPSHDLRSDKIWGIAQKAHKHFNHKFVLGRQHTGWDFFLMFWKRRKVSRSFFLSPLICHFWKMSSLSFVERWFQWLNFLLKLCSLWFIFPFVWKRAMGSWFIVSNTILACAFRD